VTGRACRRPSGAAFPEEPVDPHGIAPDVTIPAEESDEIAFVQRRLET
jgi:hypothetical protein